MMKKLLLADDSITIQKVVGIIFSTEEYQLEMTDDGDSAFRKALDEIPDLVIADISMPGKDGFELCRAIKSEPSLSNTSVMLLPGAFDHFDEMKANEVCADGWLTKPFESQALLDKVSQLLDAEPVRMDGVAPAEEEGLADVSSPENVRVDDNVSLTDAALGLEAVDQWKPSSDAEEESPEDIWDAVSFAEEDLQEQDGNDEEGEAAAEDISFAADVMDPAVYDDVADEVVADEVVADEVVADEVVADEVVTDEVVTDEVVTDEVVTDEVVTDEVVTDEVVTDEVAFTTFSSDDNGYDDSENPSDFSAEFDGSQHGEFQSEPFVADSIVEDEPFVSSSAPLSVEDSPAAEDGSGVDFSVFSNENTDKTPLSLDEKTEDSVFAVEDLGDESLDGGGYFEEEPTDVIDNVNNFSAIVADEESASYDVEDAEDTIMELQEEDEFEAVDAEDSSVTFPEENIPADVEILDLSVDDIVEDEIPEEDLLEEPVIEEVEPVVEEVEPVVEEVEPVVEEVEPVIEEVEPAAEDEGFYFDETPAEDDVDSVSVEDEPIPAVALVSEGTEEPAVAQIEQQLRELSEEELMDVVTKVAGPIIEKMAAEMLEQVAWEVVPDLAEAMISEEIRKIKEGS